MKKTLVFCVMVITILIAGCGDKTITQQNISSVMGFTDSQASVALQILSDISINSFSIFEKIEDSEDEEYHIVCNQLDYWVVVKNGTIDWVINSEAKTAYRNIDNLPLPESKSEVVDYIITVARENSKKINSDTINIAMKYLSEHYPDYFVDNETMEHSLYYGYLLNLACEETIPAYSNIGYDVFKAVKDVYRGYEEIDSEFTQAVLDEIYKDFLAISEAFE